MKLNFLLIICLLFSFSVQGFLTNDQIVSGFKEKEKNNPKIENEKLTEKEQLIKDNLVPLNELIPPKIQKKLDANKKKLEPSLKRFLVKNGTGVDLREFDTPLKQQWNGTCTTFGLIAAMENYLKGKVDLSERDLWNKYQRYSSSVAIKTAENVKICIEEYWKQSNLYPDELCQANRIYGLKAGTQYLGDNVDKVIKSLDDGFPVYIAMSTPSDMYQCKKYIDEYSGATGGGHALAIVGYKVDSRLDSGGYFILKNSWGDTCGDGGYQYLDHNFCKKKGKYCLMWKIDNVEKIEPDPVIEKKCIEYKRLWYYLFLKKTCIRWK